MNLDPTETQTLLRETVRSYLEKEVPYDRIRQLERDGAADELLWKAVLEQGWLALPFDEALGGSGSLVDAGLLVEELARRAAIVPVADAFACGRVLERYGGAAGEALIRTLLDGGARVVPAVGAADAVPTFEGDRLTGEVPFVDYGEQASHHLVEARDARGRGLYLVATATAGVRCAPLRSIGRTPLCGARYDAVPAQRVGDAAACAELLRLARSFAALQCVGSMQQALDMTLIYAKVREQFGRPIGSFQAVHHHCANMAMRVASARLLAYEALSNLDAGRASDAGIALAKASASRAAPEVLMLAHQIHGGNGVIEENDLYFFTLRGKDRSLAWGSLDECLATAAEAVDNPTEWL